MQTLIAQIKQSANSPAYYLTLFAALTLPDICSAMTSCNGEANRSRYIAWFDEYVAPKYVVGPDQSPSFSGENCYFYRCSILHQGSSQHPKNSYSRVLFVEPNERVFLHNNVINDTLNLDIRRFCLDICESAETWLAAAQATDQYQANYQKFMRRYPEGLPPYIVGIPLIA